MADKKDATAPEPEVPVEAPVEETPAVEPESQPVADPSPETLPSAEVPGWPGVPVETPEEHDAKRRAEAAALNA